MANRMATQPYLMEVIPGVNRMATQPCLIEVSPGVHWAKHGRNTALRVGLVAIWVCHRAFQNITE